MEEVTKHRHILVGHRAARCAAAGTLLPAFVLKVDSQAGRGHSHRYIVMQARHVGCKAAQPLQHSSSPGLPCLPRHILLDRYSPCSCIALCLRAHSALQVGAPLSFEVQAILIAHFSNGDVSECLCLRLQGFKACASASAVVPHLSALCLHLQVEFRAWGQTGLGGSCQ